MTNIENFRVHITRTRTNTHLYGTEASAAGKNALALCLGARGVIPRALLGH